MSNILNSQNMNINNTIAARKISGNTNSTNNILAPASLPKYSIDKVLQEQDEFRRNIRTAQNEQLYKTNKKHPLIKLGVILAAVGGFFLLKGKK